MTDQKSVIRIYTDGACSGNPGPGAYAAILTYKGKEITLTRHFRLTTNNRMELLAVIDSLKAIKSEGYPIEIFSDSTYVVNAINQNWLSKWKKKGWKNVKNKDLWHEFDQLYHRLKPTFRWVKGHNNHPYNERCDQLAVESIAKPNPESDVVFEESLKSG